MNCVLTDNIYIKLILSTDPDKAVEFLEKEKEKVLIVQ